MTEVDIRNQILLDAKVSDNPYYQGSRITQMINQAQRWLQGKLITQGFNRWKVIDTVTLSGISPAVSRWGITAFSTGDVPTDWLKTEPIIWVRPASSNVRRPARYIKRSQIHEIVNNLMLTPTTEYPIFTVDQDTIYLHPAYADFTTSSIYYVKIITALVYNDDTTESEINDDEIEMVIDRVGMQIKANNGNEQIKQAQLAEIDKEIINKYQLDVTKTEQNIGKRIP